MNLEKTDFEGLYIAKPEIIEDNRGSFAKLYNLEDLKSINADINFVEQNVSVSRSNVIRGLHFQWNPPLGKLIRAITGKVFAVAADLRKKSPTFGKWFSIELNGVTKIALYSPAGFAFGFCVIDGPAEIQYLYTSHFNPNGESGIIWNDPTLNIDWPIQNPILSDKDTKAKTFKEWLERPESDLF